MKAQERHHLKQNEFVTGVATTTSWVRENRDKAVLAVIAVVAVIALVSGYFWWKQRNAEQGGALLGVAMTIYQAPIIPASNVPGAVQQPGTYASEKARYEAALAAFQQVIDAHPSSKAALAARYHQGETYASLGRFPEAQKAYEDVIKSAGSDLFGAVAKLGLASTQLAAGQGDQAIKNFEELAAQRDGLVPVDGVLMQLAAAYEKLGKKAEARTTYKRVVDEFPESNYVQGARAQMALLVG
jgi:TolA-binding protein